MSKVIRPGSTIGIIGGGQLGRMLCIAAKQMGYKTAVLEPASSSPCEGLADVLIQARYDDKEAARELAAVSDVITYEFENIDAETAALLTEEAYFPQGFKLLQTTQHRIREKDSVSSLGIEVAPYQSIKNLNDCQAAAKDIGFPAVLKTCRGGYDGKGQAVVHDEAELLKEAKQLLESGELVLEGFIPFKCEISIIVTRSTLGEVKTFPVSENIHVNSILHQSIVPARVEAEWLKKAETIAETIADGLGLTGILAIEMFVTNEGEVIVNELAPRPHNSGHYTIEGCFTSQFEQHIRAICGLPLGSTHLLGATVMENILGQHLEEVISELDYLSEAKLHLYGKKEAKDNRKMGHITAMGDTVEDALEKLKRRVKRMC
ncbi:5-(carboxyamino)imidazole ribonucleotide synthase [Alkalihalophilus marmarensis]|jgi:5-(carboxyamino)imidazole ribonucleotide synthase|uniref:N5-carboxyaminoimidazole ribonucleotide synthase n=1 Tax=Alkalihalophilus marmarensis DSM 21297 TaxID=1188261 RepID=U6SI25_9BACI|nr:5-(carboxyamino)imidazole ribonucleotide synthase [Alkalihalophilus marmarensis]ERN51344.1 phosphoribosylaminoimidazole carboxylase [Alkalihalophilus marmarensis DSM 21297]MCM3490446.1 5-(carboxyamino)imidazole ribonucleotide synthase [Alkalihalophilus marmarensis]